MTPGSQVSNQLEPGSTSRYGVYRTWVILLGRSWAVSEGLPVWRGNGRGNGTSGSLSCPGVCQPVVLRPTRPRLARRSGRRLPSTPSPPDGSAKAAPSPSNPRCSSPANPAAARARSLTPWHTNWARAGYCAGPSSAAPNRPTASADTTRWATSRTSGSPARAGGHRTRRVRPHRRTPANSRRTTPVCSPGASADISNRARSAPRCSRRNDRGCCWWTSSTTAPPPATACEPAGRRTAAARAPVTADPAATEPGTLRRHGGRRRNARLLGAWENLLSERSAGTAAVVVVMVGPVDRGTPPAPTAPRTNWSRTSVPAPPRRPADSRSASRRRPCPTR